ncbi:hypothetical protein AJ80_09506 [Polytolypa hystricis UAMH7299]|uniref:PAP-associated domain-containing protein n=1 Tax=Polytolypa hystricis (strain UAMH7299) TaxID=1447883 RepID=A0A2B7WQ27_POLH7|nr:hypothetical protein AJ80_09506 [Polytolypa hystricis UAMH7299]
MVVTFLQTRFPPILPSLQQGCEEKNKVKLQDDSPSTYFEDDLDKLVGLGRENKSTLGDLLFHFFRYYGHEVNFEANVVSVREGKLISKEGKGWHLLQNNRLCVEEPFNTSRNLGNTADDTSFRGLHMELRRAFTAVSEGKFEECCVQYEYPPEEERSWERPPPQPRPILSAIPSVPSRGGRGGGRGGRHANNYNRGPNTGGRRPSSAANRANNVRHTNPSFSAEIALQAQHLLHDHLYQQIQLLQAQEAELRMQLQNQSLLTGRPPPTMIRQPYLQFPVPPQDTSAADENSRARAGTVNHPPLTTPIRQQVFYHPSFLPVAMPGIQGPNTNPPSPSLAPAMPDVRRSHRRSSITNTSPRGPLRAQSQPAPAQFNLGALYSSVANPEGASALQGSPKRGTGEKDGLMPNGVPILPKGAFLTENRPSEYVGYYVGDPAHSQAARTTSIISPLAVSGGLAIQSGGFPSLARSSPEHGSSSRTAHSDRISSSLQDPHPLSTSLQSSQSRPLTRSRTQQDQGPLIVDGSVPVTERRNSIHADHGDHFMAMSPSISTSEDRPYNTPGSTSDMSQDVPDHVFYDDEYDIYERSRQGVQNHTHINGWKPTINGVAINGNIGRLELQRLQFADAVPAVDFYRRKPSTNQLRDNNNSYFFSVNDNSLEKDRHVQDKIPEPAVNTVPPAKEARTTSQPKARANGVDTERVGNASGNNKGKSKGRQDHSHAANAVQAADKKDKRGDHSHRKPNGNASSNGAHGQTHVSSSTSSWQTSKKKHRKGAKDTADTNRVHLPNGAEPLPADESLRKGG